MASNTTTYTSPPPPPAIDIKQIAYEAAHYKCIVGYLPVKNAQLKYAIGCIANNAISADEVKCVNIAPENVPANVDCTYIVKGGWYQNNTGPMYCWGVCNKIDATSSNNAVSSVFANAAVTVYPSIMITFAALFFAMIMSSKQRNN